MKRYPFTLLLLLLSLCLPARVIYVAFDATGLGDGTSWANAFPDLQDAIDSAVGDGEDSLFVKAGTYYPPRTNFGSDAPNVIRARTFYNSADVRLFGGFTGIETSLDQRNWRLNETILSGDLGVVGDDSDNAYHVLKFETGTVSEVNGFIIRQGRATGNGSSSNGAGMYIREMDTAILSKLIIEENLATEDGGGVYVINSLITGIVKMEEVVIRHCSSRSGAGFYTSGINGSLHANRVHLYHNQATGSGGGMFIRDITELDLSNLLISHNTSGSDGAALWLRATSGNLTNLTVYGNSSTAGIGGGLFGDLNVFVGVYNSIFWENSDTNGSTAATSQLAEDGTEVDVRFCNIQGSNGSGASWAADATDQGNNIDVGPDFVDPDGADDIPGTEDDNFRLAITSPLIDQGTAVAPNLPRSDFFGDQRVQGSGVDMGISENPDGGPFPVEYVYFRGHRNLAAVELQWQTSRELNHAYFIVERAVNHQPDRWEAVGQVVNGEASPQGKAYRFTDQLSTSYQEASHLYYRLRQVDLDGSFNLSSILVMTRPHLNPLTLTAYPNPAREQISIRLSQPIGQDGMAKLYDFTGKQCLRQPLSPSEGSIQPLDLSGIPTGTYLLQVIIGQQLLTERIQVR
jgi:hypothetical protein